MKRKILKAVGYIMLTIGIIGGLSTIGMIFNGNLVIWILLVVCLCGIGIISLSASNEVNKVGSEVIYAKRDCRKSYKETYNHILQWSKIAYYSIREQMIRIDYLYFKVILTIIAVLLLIIAIELNDKLSEIAFKIHRK
ncbi:MAG: hypothetical protein K2O00_04315 [Muribaculaceae bacterium]|nr:hypothetical protein [Muribaculaceae bacterium]